MEGLQSMRDLWNVFYTCWTCQPYFIYCRPEIYGSYFADKKCMEGLLYTDGLWKLFPHEHFLFPNPVEDFPSRKNPAEKPVETRGWHFMHMRRSQSLSRPFKILLSVEDLLQIFSL